jgi:sugar/nucleoside kinase (ribokinase family)
VADQDGTRTWFPYLPGVADCLGALDLGPLARASFAYIDCYQLIEAPAVRAVGAVRSSDVPLLLNLGGSALSAAVADALRGCAFLVVQTSVDEAAFADAPQVAESILAATGATWAVVTGGARGALAQAESAQVSVPAFRVDVRHTHCAGAAFSGGLVYGLLSGWQMDACLTLACASGALRCERAHREPMPALDDLRAVIGSRDRLGSVA